MRSHEHHDHKHERDLAREPARELEQDMQSEALAEEEQAERSAHYFEVVGLVERLFKDGDESLVHQHKGLADDEREALALMAHAIHGRIGSRDMLAEDRLAELGMALAGLQPVLAAGVATGVGNAVSAFYRMVDQVDGLRTRLVNLEDAQGEVFHQDRAVEEVADGGEQDDEAKPTGDKKGAAAKKVSKETDADDAETPIGERSTTLTGKPGEAAVERDERSTTLTGKPGEAAVERDERPSSLGADEK